MAEGQRGRERPLPPPRSAAPGHHRQTSPAAHIPLDLGAHPGYAPAPANAGQNVEPLPPQCYPDTKPRRRGKRTAR